MGHPSPRSLNDLEGLDRVGEGVKDDRPINEHRGRWVGVYIERVGRISFTPSPSRASARIHFVLRVKDALVILHPSFTFTASRTRTSALSGQSPWDRASWRARLLGGAAQRHVPRRAHEAALSRRSRRARTSRHHAQPPRAQPGLIVGALSIRPSCVHTEYMVDQAISRMATAVRAVPSGAATSTSQGTQRGDPQGPGPLAAPAIDPEAGPEEQLLHRLVVGELPVVAALERAQLQLARALLGLVDQPSNLRIVAGALKDTVQLSNAIGRRLQDALAATATLRAQRRLLTIQERRNGDGG